MTDWNPYEEETKFYNPAKLERAIESRASWLAGVGAWAELRKPLDKVNESVRAWEADQAELDTVRGELGAAKRAGNPQLVEYWQEREAAAAEIVECSRVISDCDFADLEKAYKEVLLRRLDG